MRRSPKRTLLATFALTVIFAALHGFLGASIARRDPLVSVLTGRGAELVLTIVPFALLRFTLYFVMPPIIAALLTRFVLRSTTPSTQARASGPRTESPPSERLEP